MQLTTEQREVYEAEYDLCSSDPIYWITNYGYIRDEQTGIEFGPGLTLWDGVRGYPGQRDFTADYANGVSLNALKGRQIGLSWLAENIDLWDILFHARIRLGIIDKREDDAYKHIARLRMIYEAQPFFLTAQRQPYRGHDSKHEFALGNKGDYSVIESHPCTAAAARGVAAKRIRMEEPAFYQNLADVLAAVKAATADNDAQLVEITTANGEGTIHHARWLDSVAGRNSLKPMFLPFDTRPGRDEAWREKQLRDYTSRELGLQELPASPEEAFLAAGSKYFNRQEIDDCYYEMEPIDQPYPGWSIYAGYEGGGTYFISGDTSDAGGDACSASVRHISGETCEQVAHIHSYDWDSGAFADQLADLGKRYGYPMIVLEREGYGMKTYERLRSTWKYPRLYVHEDGRDGLPTTQQTRPMMLSDLAIAKRELRWIEHSPQTYAEEVAFAWIKGKPEAPAGMHDDCVMESAVGARVLPKMASQTYMPQARKSDIYR